MKSAVRLAMAHGAMFAFLMLTSSAAHAACGNGILEGGEECDAGPNLFIDGDPAKGTCSNGSRCYYQFTCCKFNCQYVGTPGTPCQDGNSCTGPDTCDNVGICNGGPNAANDTPCDDGLFCTGTESCQYGACTASTGDPCPGTACNHCQEATDTCFDLAGSNCSEGDSCVSGGTCNGTGTCNGGVFNEGPCDDGIYCNGTDTCSGGGCSVHTGDPCSESGSGSSDCTETCNEAADLCNSADLDGSPCDDGLFCNGATDACETGTCVGTGSVACDDGNSCTTDTCDEMADSCIVGGPLPDGTSCDDADDCTTGDTCAAGVCVGDPPTMQDLCPWTVVLREYPTRDLMKTEIDVDIDGDVCGGTIKLASATHITSDLVSDETTGIKQIVLPKSALIDDDIVTGGAGVNAYSPNDELPYSALPALAPGSLTAKQGTGVTGNYDLQGTHALAGDCHAARTSYPTAVADVEAFAATQPVLPSLKIPAAGSQTITATVVGGMNVVDITTALTVLPDAELVLDGGGNADTVMVIRVGGKMKLLKRSSISLIGGLTPDHVLFYAHGKGAGLSDLSLGSGTLLVTPGKLKVGRTVAWVGAFLADGKRMRIRQTTGIHHTPFTGF